MTVNRCNYRPPVRNCWAPPPKLPKPCPPIKEKCPPAPKCKITDPSHPDYLQNSFNFRRLDAVLKKFDPGKDGYDSAEVQNAINHVKNPILKDALGKIDYHLRESGIESIDKRDLKAIAGARGKEHDISLQDLADMPQLLADA